MAAVTACIISSQGLAEDSYVVEMKLHRRLFGLVKARHGAFSLNDTGLTTPEVPLDSKVKLNLKIMEGGTLKKRACTYLALKDVGANSAVKLSCPAANKGVVVGLSLGSSAAAGAPAEAPSAQTSEEPKAGRKAQPPLAANNIKSSARSEAAVQQQQQQQQQPSGEQPGAGGASATEPAKLPGNGWWRRKPSSGSAAAPSRSSSEDASASSASNAAARSSLEHKGADVAAAAAGSGAAAAAATSSVPGSAAAAADKEQPGSKPGSILAGAAPAGGPSRAGSTSSGWLERVRNFVSSAFASSGTQARKSKHGRTKSEGAAIKPPLARTSLAPGKWAHCQVAASGQGSLLAHATGWRNLLRKARVSVESDPGLPTEHAVEAKAEAADEMDRMLLESLARGFDRGVPLTGALEGWYTKEVVSRVNSDARATVIVCYAAFDQTSQLANGACSIICVMGAAWLLMHDGCRLSAKVMDMLTYRGGKAWKEHCGIEGAAAFANGHFDLEFALQTLPHLGSNPDNEHFALLGEDAGDMSLAATLQRLRPGVYILCCRDHFILLHLAPEALYVMDSLGCKLDPRCKATYLLRFATPKDFASYFSGVYHAAPKEEPAVAAAPAANGGAAAATATASGGKPEEGGKGGKAGSKLAAALTASKAVPAKAPGPSSLLREMASSQVDIFGMRLLAQLQPDLLKPLNPNHSGVAAYRAARENIGMYDISASAATS